MIILCQDSLDAKDLNSSVHLTYNRPKTLMFHAIKFLFFRPSSIVIVVSAVVWIGYVFSLVFTVLLLR